MLRFLAGLAFGVVLAVGFVWFGWAPPGLLTLPARLQGNVVASAVEGPLYDLAGDPDQRLRALEVYFRTRAQDAARLDAASGGPFLQALHRERARREARQLLALWSGYDEALAQPALREALERRTEARDPDTIKRRMLMQALDEAVFLNGWMQANGGPVSEATALERLRPVAAQEATGPAPADVPAP